MVIMYPIKKSRKTIVPWNSKREAELAARSRKHIDYVCFLVKAADGSESGWLYQDMSVTRATVVYDKNGELTDELKFILKSEYDEMMPQELLRAV